MKKVMELLEKNPQVSDYKILIHKKESFELFFVKGKLETVRSTDTCDKQVTVYVNHGEFKGDSLFYIYPSTTDAQIEEKIQSAVQNALLINNQNYELPPAETDEYIIPSNFSHYDPVALATKIAQGVFDANGVEHGSLNSVEVFINHHKNTVMNSKGLCKTQDKYDAMVEAIPTYNGEEQSVELYEQYNFNTLDMTVLQDEIARKMEEVKARYTAQKPEQLPSCKIVLNKLELEELFGSIASDLNYATVYGHANLYKKGDNLQKNRTGDPITVTMAGSVPGNVKSACFDSDGLSLGKVQLVADGQAVSYYGSNRFGQYLGEKPTGNLSCLCVSPGSLDIDSLKLEPHLEVISMSGLQVDFFNDYIGGEIRLAYYHDGTKCIPVTGISIAGKLQEVLSSIRLSVLTATHDRYTGPAKALIPNMNIF